jgi:hypothetical protein
MMTRVTFNKKYKLKKLKRKKKKRKGGGCRWHLLRGGVWHASHPRVRGGLQASIDLRGHPLCFVFNKK